MKLKLTEHILGLILVSMVMVGVVYLLQQKADRNHEKQYARVKHIIDAPISKINDPFERALLSDCLDLFYPGQYDSNSVLVQQFFKIKETEFNQSLQSSYHSKKLTPSTVIEIMRMYLKFLLIYLIVMVLTYYGVQTLGTLRFILKQQSLQYSVTGQSKKLHPFFFLQTFAKTIAYFILFSPAYVIAYSIRTEFNTDSSFFMILLGVISNGLLITYMNKFYTFLVTESRKGYVENAFVKNLHSSYSFSDKSGISLGSILRPHKHFSGHIFDHIFRNANLQYLSTIKEQASFLITGLVIIEMALNIHGHLTYELLRQLLYKNHTLVVTIMLLIFFTVKFTEIVTDILVHRETKRYEN